IHKCTCQIAMRLLGRGWQQSLIGAYEKPPAMPEDIYLSLLSECPYKKCDIQLKQIGFIELFCIYKLIFSR
ncbi:hypothetical protein, partial [Serratia fonticola]|uniref:hypothetical protein n=1 Tax=Serratia fonticola TaxID=47917 RepID=UPI0021B7E0D9